jgi:hypothetical protein
VDRFERAFIDAYSASNAQFLAENRLLFNDDRLVSTPHSRTVLYAFLGTILRLAAIPIYNSYPHANQIGEEIKVYLLKLDLP